MLTLGPFLRCVSLFLPQFSGFDGRAFSEKALCITYKPIKAKGLNPKGAYIHIRSPGSGNLTGFTDELTLYARSY